MIVEEAWIGKHLRVVTVKNGGLTLYSIDFYCRLPQVCPGASLTLSLGPVKLYEAPLGEGCTAVILETPSGVEAISLRLTTNSELSPEEARERCLKAWRESPCGASARC